MSLGDSDIAHVHDLFSDIPDLTTRKMFGGLGIYAGGDIFALMRSDGQLLLKAVKGPFADHLAQQGCAQWTYTRKSGAASAMPYWQVPDSMLDDPATLNSLAQRALTALNERLS